MRAPLRRRALPHPAGERIGRGDRHRRFRDGPRGQRLSASPPQHRRPCLSERHFLVARGATTAAEAAGLGIAAGAEQFEAIHPYHGLAALFARGPVGPAIKLQGADDPDQGALADVVRGDLGLLAPDLEVEPVGFVVAATTVDGEGQVGDDAAGFEVAHFGIPAGPADKGHGIHAHGLEWSQLDQ